jgi:hypothetical protein
MKEKQVLDTPRDGKNWCDVINKEPLPDTRRDVVRMELSPEARKLRGLK